MEMIANDEGIIFQGKDFSITWERLNADGVQSWIAHLIDKQWFTLDVEEKFIASVGKYYELKGRA